MNTVATDYAFLMLKMEQYQRVMHDACLRKQWSEARKHAAKIDCYCEALMYWLQNQEDHQDGRFEEVRLPQPEAV